MTIPVLLDRLEHEYRFVCHGGPLGLCEEWRELKKHIAALERRLFLAERARWNADAEVALLTMHEP